MRSLITTTAFLVGISSAAFAGGNPEDEQAAPVPPTLDTQAIIQELVEDEIFAEPQIPAEPLRAGIPAGEELAAELSDPLPVPEKASECASFWVAAAELLGGECYRDSNFHNPSPVEYTTVYDTKTVYESKTKHFSKKFGHSKFAKKIAKKAAKHLRSKGWTATVAYKKGWRVFAKKVIQVPVTVPTVTRIRSDLGNDVAGDTASNSNFSDRERDFGAGRGNK